MKYASDEEVNEVFGRVTRKYAIAIKNLERGGRVHMKDFTKGELRIIKQCVYFEGWKSESENANQPLLDKIQRVIDDYCDHPVEFLADDNFCTKCNMYLV